VAKRYGMIVIIVAHPKKLDEGAEPTLYSISGSAHWKNKADHGIIIVRGSDENGDLLEAAKVRVEKSKDHETTGIPGFVMVKFSRESCDYSKI
jgi:twinkle protein